MREFHDKLCDMELAFLDSKSPPTPAGWKLVQEEPTPAMISAGSDAERAWMVDMTTEEDKYAVQYRAMLGAAPQPPQEGEGCPQDLTK